MTTYTYKDENRDWWKLTIKHLCYDPKEDQTRWEYALYRDEGTGYKKTFTESYWTEGGDKPFLETIMEDIARRIVSLTVGFAVNGKKNIQPSPKRKMK